MPKFYIDKTNDSIKVLLDTGMLLEFKAEYSPYEDCVDLLLFVNGNQEIQSLDIFVGYDDNANDRADKRRNE